MNLPAPPADLDRRQRKAFREMAQSLAARGIDAHARSRLVGEIVRLESRLEGLRDAEKQAESGSKLAATRAVNVAGAELRRLLADAFRGAAKAPQSEASSEGESEADRAWRARLWGGDRSVSHDELQRRHGNPTWAALLYPTHQEWEGWQRLVAEFADRQRIPSSRIAQHREECGGALGFETIAPDRLGGAP